MQVHISQGVAILVEIRGFIAIRLNGNVRSRRNELVRIPCSEKNEQDIKECVYIIVNTTLGGVSENQMIKAGVRGDHEKSYLVFNS
jgi:hypothetical protein